MTSSNFDFYFYDKKIPHTNGNYIFPFKCSFGYLVKVSHLTAEAIMFKRSTPKPHFTSLDLSW